LEDFFRSPRSILRANGHTKCSWYLLAFSLAAALPAERRVSARRGWAGEKSSLSEQPAGNSASVSDLRRGVISGVIILFANKLLAWNDLSEVAVIEDLPSVIQLIEQWRASWDIQLQHLFSGELLQLHDKGS